MKRLKKILAIMVIATVMISSSGCDLVRAIIGLYNAPSYAQRQYVEPNKDETDKLFNEIKELCAETNKGTKIIAKRNSFMMKYTQASTSRIVAMLEYYNNVTDGEAKARAERIENYFNQLHNQALEMEKTILQSSYAKLLTDSLGQDYADGILNQTVKSDEVIALESRISELENEYSTLTATPNASNYAEQMAKIFKELIVTRNKIAKQNTRTDGTTYSNYHEYAYDKVYSRKYTPEDAAVFRQAIKDNLYDVGKKLYDTSDNYITGEARTAAINENGIKQFMPQIINGTAESMLKNWNYMMSKGLYNFTISPNKYPNSFVIEFAQYGDGFMFINASGSLLSDLSTIVHEFGHYNAIFATDENKEGSSSIYSIDLAETHSQAFELITLPTVKKVFESNNIGNVYTAYADNLLLQSVWSMLSNSLFDEFEYTVYTADENALTADYFENTFNEIWQKYWSLNKDGKPTYNYYDISHLFTSPSYCISYSVSMVFASEIWMSSTPVTDYLNVVSYGSGHYISDVAAAAGLSDPLKAETIANIAQNYKTQLKNILGLSFGDGTFDA